MLEHGTHFDIGDDQMGIWYRVTSKNIAGRSISELNVRGETGATITAVRSRGQTIAFPDAVFKLELNDEVYAVGNSDQLYKLEMKFAFVQSKYAAEGSNEVAPGVD